MGYDPGCRDGVAREMSHTLVVLLVAGADTCRMCSFHTYVRIGRRSLELQQCCARPASTYGWTVMISIQANAGRMPSAMPSGVGPFFLRAFPRSLLRGQNPTCMK